MTELRPHQREALSKLKNGSILHGGVGSGKSRVALAYYIDHPHPSGCHVITTAKKRDSLDWYKEAANLGMTDTEDLGSGKLTVDSWNNLAKYENVKRSFFVFDEQRLVGSARGAWVRSFLKIVRNNEWIMLTATPGDTWLDYIAVFVANGFYKNYAEFKREHVVYVPYLKYPKFDRYVNVGKLVRQRNQILVSMPYAYQTVRHKRTQWCEFDKKMMNTVVKDRWDPFANEPIADISKMFYLMRRVANSDPSRSERLQQLMERHPKLVVFYNFDYELDILRMLTGTFYWDEVYPHAEWNGHRHQEIPKTDKWVYLVQYMAGAEGWNCTETDAMAFYSLNYSWKLFEQAQGRIDRLNTPFSNLFYYIFRSKSMIDLAIWASLTRKENFQERSLRIEK